jgi:hypothetical protein
VLFALPKLSPSLAGWALGGQSARNNLFAPRVLTIIVVAKREAVLTFARRFDETLCEVSYISNPCRSAASQDRRARLGSRFRQCRSLVELLVLWH